MWLYAKCLLQAFVDFGVSVSAISDLTWLMILSSFPILHRHFLIFSRFFEPDIAIKKQRHSFLSQCSLKAH